MSEQSLTIPGVPPAISRELVLEIIRTLGIDPYQVCGLEFKPDGVYVEVHALDQRGQRFTADTFAAATHRLCIPIVDETEKDVPTP